MASNPLAEVFGFPITTFSKEAKRFRRNKLCPFNNRVPSCTKDKANDPLGVCSIFDDEKAIITCPIRFREKWLITEQAAEFFFQKTTAWTSLTEVRLKDKRGNVAGNIDLVMVSYDTRGRVTDFGSLEIQAVYISGNVRSPFAYYMEDTFARQQMDWRQKPNYPKPDFLSSSRKRLLPQILYKGGIIKAWGKKQAVVLQKDFFDTLPKIPRVKKNEAEIAWLLYKLKKDTSNSHFCLTQEDIVYTKFSSALQKITKTPPGNIKDFINVLQDKLDEKLEGNPPDTKILDGFSLQ